MIKSPLRNWQCVVIIFSHLSLKLKMSDSLCQCLDTEKKERSQNWTSIMCIPQFETHARVSTQLSFYLVFACEYLILLNTLMHCALLCRHMFSTFRERSLNLQTCIIYRDLIAWRRHFGVPMIPWGNQTSCFESWACGSVTHFSQPSLTRGC